MPHERAPSQAVAPTLYQEVQLSPSPASPSSILNIDTTGSSQQLTLFGAGRKRGFAEISGLDEETFARKHLASEASVFFRRASTFPRSFLWRVLNDRQLLEIQCVDLVADKRQASQEGCLTFHIAVPAAIAKGGVAFADVEEPDALDVFILTATHELYTIRLKSGVLASVALPTAFDATKVVKKYAPSSFAFRYPYRMVAVGSREIFVSLHDGALLRLQREVNGDGSHWQETLYSEGSWTGTLRGLNPLKRRQTVRYGDLELETNAAADMAMSPDGDHLWTVGLDHTLKAWNPKTGKVVHQMDLLRDKSEEGQRRQPRFLMTPEQGTLIRVLEAPNADDGAVATTREYRRYFLVVQSPEEHQFKIYEINPTFSSVDGEGLRCVDLQPTVKFIPPVDELLKTNIWHMEEFHVKPGPDWQDTRIWIRARSGAVCKTFILTFDPLLEDAEDLESTFRNGWTVVDNGPLSIDGLRSSDDFPGQLISSADTFATPTERWMAFLFYPGRFSTGSIEAALSAYRKKRKLSTSSSRGMNAPQPPLQDRLITAITSKIVLHRSPDDQPSYDRYQADVHAQWMGFYSILEDLHAQRLESLALAFDRETELPWCVGADTVAPVRSNDGLELMCLNTNLLEKCVSPEIQHMAYPKDEDIVATVLIDAARQLRLSTSAEARDIFKNLAMQEALIDDDDVDALGLEGLCEKADVWNEVSEEAEATLGANVQYLNGLGSIDNNVLFLALEALDDTPDSNPKAQNKTLCRYGDKLFVAVAQQSLQRNEAVLLDLLLLLSFMVGCLRSEELDAGLNPTEIYDAIRLRLRYTAFRQWMASHERIVASEDGGSVALTLTSVIHDGDWDSRADVPDDAGAPAFLTNWAKRWAYGVDLYKDWTAYTAWLLADLLRDKLYDLASDVARFVPTTPWSRYLRARLHLATGEYDLAALAFHEAAPDLSAKASLPKNLIDQTVLLSGEEKNAFGQGLSLYYQHIASLFEKLRIHSHVADFCSHALKNIHGAASVDRDIARIDARKAIPDSPAQAQVNDTLEELRLLRTKELRDDVAARLFSALVQTGRFEEAHDALRKTQSKLERANLKTLVEACIKNDAVDTLLSLPLSDDLAREADAVLLALAQKTLASGSTSGAPHHQILYSFRTTRGNFRGAAEILHEWLQRLLASSAPHLQDPEDETVLQVYLLLINTLACCGEGEGWLLAEPIVGVHEVVRKRKLVTLEEVRREYGAEMDRRSDVLQGRFPFAGRGEEMDVF